MYLKLNCYLERTIWKYPHYSTTLSLTTSTDPYRTQGRIWLPPTRLISRHRSYLVSIKSHQLPQQPNQSTSAPPPPSTDTEKISHLYKVQTPPRYVLAVVHNHTSFKQPGNARVATHTKAPVSREIIVSLIQPQHGLQKTGASVLVPGGLRMRNHVRLFGLRAAIGRSSAL